MVSNLITGENQGKLIFQFRDCVSGSFYMGIVIGSFSSYNNYGNCLRGYKRKEISKN